MRKADDDLNLDVVRLKIPPAGQARNIEFSSEGERD
jgi:hypothetical protein